MSSVSRSASPFHRQWRAAHRRSAVHFSHASQPLLLDPDLVNTANFGRSFMDCCSTTLSRQNMQRTEDVRLQSSRLIISMSVPAQHGSSTADQLFAEIQEISIVGTASARLLASRLEARLCGRLPGRPVTSRLQNGLAECRVRRL